MFWPLKERATKYRSSIKRNDGTGPVARHFKEKQHISSLFFIGSEVINPVKEVVMSILSGKGERHFGFFLSKKFISRGQFTKRQDTKYVLFTVFC